MGPAPRFPERDPGGNKTQGPEPLVDRRRPRPRGSIAPLQVPRMQCSSRQQLASWMLAPPAPPTGEVAALSHPPAVQLCESANWTNRTGPLGRSR